MFGEKTEKILLRVGIFLLLIAFITIGASSKIMEKKIGEDIKEYTCQILELDEGSTIKRTSDHKRRTIYHFNATVEVDGTRMTLTPGNAEYYTHKYDVGDMISVYEYNNEYSLTRSDFLVVGPWRIISIMGIAIGIMCLMMVLVSKMAGSQQTKTKSF